MAVRSAWTGDAAEGQRWLEPIRACAPAVLGAPGAAARCQRPGLALAVPTDPWVEAHGRLLTEAMAPWTTGRRLPDLTATDDTDARMSAVDLLGRSR